jgi:N-acetylmuramoyl-L-alanine amidase
MRYFKSFLVIFILSLAALTVYSEEEAKEKFPKVGCIKNDGAVVRAGDNINFENLCVLSKSDSVNVIGRRYSWFKILLPKEAFLYINKDYVDLTSDEKGIGVINAGNVNLRAGSGTRYSIIGQISKPEQVSIISEDNGWYKIKPPYGTIGWMHSDQITLTEESEMAVVPEQKPEQKKVESKPKKETANSIVRLNTNYPTPKGNLSITTPTKKSR